MKYALIFESKPLSKLPVSTKTTGNGGLAFGCIYVTGGFGNHLRVFKVSVRLREGSHLRGPEEL